MTLSDTILLSLVSIILASLLAAFGAVVGWSYWSWFLVPLGLPTITFAHAWGLILLVAMVKGVKADEDAPNLQEQISRLIVRAGVLAVIWGAGALLAFGVTP